MPFGPASDLTFSKDQLAIGFAHGGLGGGHIGIAFHSAKDGVKLLHLCAHITLKTEGFPPPVPACWVATLVHLPASASKQLVAIVRAISKRLPKINYGINILATAGSFDAEGHYKAPKGSDGLTCATFVSTIFRDFQAPLIIETTWKPDPKNLEWGEKVYIWLRDHSTADAEHLEAIKCNIIGLRIRPDEVAAAADMPYNERPVTFEVASANAFEVEKALEDAVKLFAQSALASSVEPSIPTLSSGESAA